MGLIREGTRKTCLEVLVTNPSVALRARPCSEHTFVRAHWPSQLHLEFGIIFVSILNTRRPRHKEMVEPALTRGGNQGSSPVSDNSHDDDNHENGNRGGYS